MNDLLLSSLQRKDVGLSLSPTAPVPWNDVLDELDPPPFMLDTPKDEVVGATSRAYE